MNFLLDKEFLINLDQYPHKEIYAKLISLDLNEYPIEQIEGRVTQGSINIDGSSAVRRTCNLTLVAKDLNITNYYWGLNTKFDLEIGLRNNINDKYPDICWFKQGRYIISSFNTSQSINNFTVTINGKDKMCLLNGEVSGVLHSSVNFGVMDIEDEMTREIKHEKIILKEIIRDAVHQYGGEPFHNIIIEDLDESALELLEYRADDPAYAFKKVNTDEWGQITINGLIEVFIKENNEYKRYSTLEELTENDLIGLNKLDLNDLSKEFYIQSQEGNKFNYSGPYNIAKIEYGQTIGYRKTDLTYAGELILNVGETITTLLDKITALRSDFEYFYDLDGRFVFRQKRINIESNWSELTGEIQDTQDMTSIPVASDYIFTNSLLASAYTNTPDFNNLKNDFTVWGNRKSVNGSELPIHIRYAIDKKPEKYVTFEGQIFSSDQYDWRELIYQMAIDYRVHNMEKDFEVILAKNNPWFSTGRTGYEQYYIDMEGFWRQLYGDEHYQEVIEPVPEDINKYYTLYAGIYEPAKEFKENTTYYIMEEKNFRWYDKVKLQPELLNFWIDFLDNDGDLSQFSIKAIGDRPKAINDNNVKAIHYKETPNLIFYTDEDTRPANQDGYGYIHVGEAQKYLFTISTQGKSGTDRIDELIFQYGYCSESVNMTCIPIYYLEPNTRISIYDNNSNINGQYILQRMTIPLNYNGTMQITAVKAPPQIY